MDMGRFAVFREVAREKSFSRAAKKLYRTQPAVSQAIRLLEEETGEELFLRLGRTVELTQAGEILLEHVEEAFEALDLGQSRIQALKELKEGRVTISASDTTSCFVLPPVLESFRSRYPGVEVRILNTRSPEAARQVGDRISDLGIVTLPIDHPKVASEPLVVREDVAICSPRHELSKRRRMNFGELLAYPLLLLDKGANTRTFTDRRIEACRSKPNIVMELGSIEVIKRLVQLDFGVSIVPRVSIREELMANSLHAIRVFTKAECRKLGVIYPQRAHPALATREFMKILKEKVASKGML